MPFICTSELHGFEKFLIFQKVFRLDRFSFLLMESYKKILKGTETDCVLHWRTLLVAAPNLLLFEFLFLSFETKKLQKKNVIKANKSR